MLPAAETTPAADRAAGRLLVVANRLPVARVRSGDAKAWRVSPGGLVAALTPILAERGGAWIGWAGEGARPRAPFRHERLNLHPVTITREELNSYYLGMSNSALWPLYHDCIRTPEFRRRWWGPYVQVNQRFADAVVSLAEDDDLVWVHDYHLQLAPEMIRRRRPDLRIGFFCHIPFPPEELFARLPWRAQITRGLLGADVVGLQSALGARNFRSAARRFAGASPDGDALSYHNRTIRVGAFPISIDARRFSETARRPGVVEAAGKLRERFGAHRRIILGIDRLDYTKGIDIRLRAFEELLRRGRHTSADCVLVQVAVPSREQAADYAEMRRIIEQLVGRINGQYAEPGRVAVHYLRRNLPFDELVAFYVAADVMLVTPLRDGMNLIAKEYVASHHGPGSLVLSEFAGAANELRQAMLVNPYDIDGLATTLEHALQADPEQAARRLEHMRRHVHEHDVYAWADRFLGALAS